MAAERLMGRRVLCPFALDGSLISHWPEPGDYWFSVVEGWQAWSPAGDLTGLRNHTVTEHPDKTITVAPSILVSTGDGDQWHGYLERGVWQELDD